MNIVIHNLKVALRNLMKYKLQTAISVLSIAIGIVTFSLAHSAMSRYRLPAIFNEPYLDRSYMVSFTPINETGMEKLNDTRKYFSSRGDDVKIDTEIIQALKGNGGLRNAEIISVPNMLFRFQNAEFHLPDSTIRKGAVTGNRIDPESPAFSGIRSAVTGEKIRRLKKGEAIISEDLAGKIFGDKNPIGSVQSLTEDSQPMPVTIVDIFESTPISEVQFKNDMFFTCVVDSIEEEYTFAFDFTTFVNIVAIEGTSESSLRKEIDARVAPLGFKSELVRVDEDPEIKNVIPIRMLIHTIGALILIAAIIGFLRIEFQLFQIRRRELALRIANGGRRMQVFGCMVTEVFVVIVLSTIISLILGTILQNIIDTELSRLFSNTGLVISGLWSISLITGGLLLIACSAIAWWTLCRILNEGDGLAANMRKRRSHIFRNAMLCLQIFICLVFVISALILWKGGRILLKANNIPEKDSYYKEYIYIDAAKSDDRERLIDEIKRLPDLERMVSCMQIYTELSELADDPEIREKVNGEVFYKFYVTPDTTLLSTLGMDAKWNGNNPDCKECFLLSDSTYTLFNKLGLIDKSTLTLKYLDITLPIAGTVSNYPYDFDGKFILMISQGWPTTHAGILVPQKGRRAELAENLRMTIERNDPQLINEMTHNFRDKLNVVPSMVEAARSAGWILGIVSLIICAMSIFSTIALDTRSRRKEVAIRKVNGAKSADIYRMFGKMYAVVVLISLIPAIPVCVLFNRFVMDYISKYPLAPAHMSPVMPIVLGCLTVVLITAIIVCWQIHRVMQADPVRIIAKEQ